jgi:uracil-DNA glycosylase
MEFKAVEHKFGTWAEQFRPFIESEGFDKIFRHLGAAAKRGKVICPISGQTFRALSQTPYEALKAVFVFASPYATRYKDSFLADGIALGCANTGKVTPALEKFYRGIEQELAGGFNIDMVDAPDLSYLSAQGVLLLNSSLTVELDKPGSHQELWRPFMEYFFTEIINTYRIAVPIVFFGRYAASFSSLVYPFNRWVYETGDPMEMAVEEKWDPAGVLKNVDGIIREDHPGFDGVSWYKRSNNTEALLA